MKKSFEYGDATVPCEKKDDWVIEWFDVIDDSALMLFNMCCARDGNHFMIVEKGRYKRLIIGNKLVMSNTHMECRTNAVAFAKATGSVLITGIGLGMLPEAIIRLKQGTVTKLTVVDINPSLANHVGSHLKKVSKKIDGVPVEVVVSDAFDYTPNETFDFVWHDIWNDLSRKNLPAMRELSKKYKEFAKEQGFWSKREVEREIRRNR